MKKLTTIILFNVFTGFFQVNAQLKVNYDLGIKSGINMSQFVEKGINNNHRFSYLIGLSLEQQFNQRVSLSYDFLYSRQGNMLFFTNPGIFNKLSKRYDYLIVPVSLRYRLKRYPFIITPGFQVGHLVNHKTTFLPKNGSYTNNSDPLLKRIDLGPLMGLGYRLNKSLLVEVRYYQSLKTLFKGFNGIDPITGNFVRNKPIERYNQVISASLVYYPIAKLK